MIHAIYNLVSIGCGLVAIALPIVAAVKSKPAPGLSTWSFVLCTVALLAQIFEYHYRVTVEDFSGLMDISGAIRGAAIILVAVVVLFNLLAALLNRIKR